MANLTIYSHYFYRKLLSIAILTIMLFCSPFYGSARVWTVDNSAGSGADHSNLQNCMNAANAGDTIIVMPSVSSYGSITFSKKLYMYSRGHSSNNIDLDRRAVISGPTFASTSSGSTLKGLYVNSAINLSSHNNVIANNYLLGGIAINASNNVIQGNIIEGVNLFAIAPWAENNLIVNNYMFLATRGGGYSGSNYFINGGYSSNIVANNIIAELISGGGSIGSGGFAFFQATYVKVYNNILWSNVAGRTTFERGNYGSVFKNNLTYSATNTPPNLPGFNYNDTMPLFEGGYDDSNLPVYSAFNKMRLKSSSMGKNGGLDSTDIGLFGQNYSFSIVGNVPGIAIFEDFQVLNPVLKKGGTLKVKVVARKPE